MEQILTEQQPQQEIMSEQSEIEQPEIDQTEPVIITKKKRNIEKPLGRPRKFATSADRIHHHYEVRKARGAIERLEKSFNELMNNPDVKKEFKRATLRMIKSYTVRQEAVQNINKFIEENKNLAIYK